MLKETASKIEIINNASVYDPGEIYFSGLQYSMFNEKNEQICEFLYCKDFLSDIIWSQVNNKPVSIYGFESDPAKTPKIDFENTRLLLRNRNDVNFMDKIDNVVQFINQVENIMDLRNSEAFVVSNSGEKNGVFALVSSARWMRSPTLVSLYTLLLRVGFVHALDSDWKDTVKGIVSGKIEPYQKNDKNYLKDSIKGIERILTVGYKNIFYKQMKFNYPEKKNISKVHNESGIVAFTGANNRFCKGWYREELAEIEKGIDESNKIVIV
jgi:hypothetical protein